MAGIVQYPPGPLVPAADSTANTYERDVIGNKTDAAVTTVGTTKSIIAYLKGLFGVAALQSTTTQTGSDSAGGAGGSIRELVASSAAAIRKITLSGNCNTPSATLTATIVIMTGPGGSETIRATGVYNLNTTISDSVTFNLDVQINLPVGTRVAWRVSLSTGTLNFATGYTIEEA